ncbi:MAG TPA: hypothetical protein VFZ25_13845 [Chloroflexota bacterium]|nr:hypothetical protein [Chloroflexota bacterium]
MRGIRHLAASALLTLGLALGSGGFAAAATISGSAGSSSNPISLISGKLVSGSLTGSSAGNFAYYSYNYSGDGSPDTLTLSLNTENPAISNSVGINLWQNGSEVETMNATGSAPGTNTLTFFSGTAGPVLVQVYNYANGTPVAYQLAFTGANAAAASPAGASTSPASSPSSTATPTKSGTASNPTELKGSMSGRLMGSTAGSYVYYTLPYAGDGSTQTVNLSFAPNDPAAANALFIAVYQNGNQLTLAQGSEAGPPGQLAVSYSSATQGPVVIQLGNYNPADTMISYTISP